MHRLQPVGSSGASVARPEPVTCRCKSGVIALRRMEKNGATLSGTAELSRRPVAGRFALVRFANGVIATPAPPSRPSSWLSRLGGRFDDDVLTCALDDRDDLGAFLLR